MDDPFDLDKLRLAWDRATHQAADARSAPLDGVKAARDPLREAHAHLDELERHMRQRFPHAELALQAFVTQLRQGLGDVAATPDPAATVHNLRETLDNLEELLEVFVLQPQVPTSTPGRR